MPKDEWKKANDRARYGPTGGRRDETPTGLERRADAILAAAKAGKHKQPKPKRAKAYLVRAKTKCFVARPGSDVWEPYTTTAPATFAAYTPADNGKYWVFSRPDGWRMKVKAHRVSLEGK